MIIKGGAMHKDTPRQRQETSEKSCSESQLRSLDCSSGDANSYANLRQSLSQSHRKDVIVQALGTKLKPAWLHLPTSGAMHLEKCPLVIKRVPCNHPLIRSSLIESAWPGGGSRAHYKSVTCLKIPTSPGMHRVGRSVCASETQEWRKSVSAVRRRISP